MSITCLLQRIRDYSSRIHNSPETQEMGYAKDVSPLHDWSVHRAHHIPKWVCAPSKVFRITTLNMNKLSHLGLIKVYGNSTTKIKIIVLGGRSCGTVS